MKKILAVVLGVLLLAGLCAPAAADGIRVPVDYSAMTDSELQELVLELIGELNARGYSFSLTMGGGSSGETVTAAPETGVSLQPSEGAIAFGRWEQDGNTENGPEPLYWRILYEEGGGFYAVCDFVIDVMPFGGGVDNWERSTLRNWLNGQFYRDAFNDEEKSIIVLRRQLNIGTPAWVASDDPATADLVFLPSLTEIEMVLPTNGERQAQPTAAARNKMNGASGAEYTAWWLRTNGDWIGQAMTVNEDGSINRNGQYGGDSLGVRPAIWMTGW